MSPVSCAATAAVPDQPLSIGRVIVGAPGGGEVSGEIKASGLCHTDLSVLDGRMGSSVHCQGLVTRKLSRDPISDCFGMMKRGEGIRTVAMF